MTAGQAENVAVMAVCAADDAGHAARVEDAYYSHIAALAAIRHARAAKEVP